MFKKTVRNTKKNKSRTRKMRGGFLDWLLGKSGTQDQPAPQPASSGSSWWPFSSSSSTSSSQPAQPMTSPMPQPEAMSSPQPQMQNTTPPLSGGKKKPKNKTYKKK